MNAMDAIYTPNYNVFLKWADIEQMFNNQPAQFPCFLLFGRYGLYFYKGEYYLKPFYAGNYDSTQAYESLTIVLYTDGKYYCSNAAIAAGVAPTTSASWVVIENASGDVSSLTSRVDALETDTATALNKATTAESNANTAVTTATTANTTANNAKTIADSANSAVTSLSGTVASNTNSINAVSSNVSTNTADIDNLNNVCAALMSAYTGRVGDA